MRHAAVWTGSELADESQQRGLVELISASHVNRILREVDLQPHRFNDTIAKPTNWTDTGWPTRNTPTQRPRTWREIRTTEKIWRKLALLGMNLSLAVIARNGTSVNESLFAD